MTHAFDMAECSWGRHHLQICVCFFVAGQSSRSLTLRGAVEKGCPMETCSNSQTNNIAVTISTLSFYWQPCYLFMVPGEVWDSACFFAGAEFTFHPLGSVTTLDNNVFPYRLDWSADFNTSELHHNIKREHKRQTVILFSNVNILLCCHGRRWRTICLDLFPVRLSLKNRTFFFSRVTEQLDPTAQV